MCDVRVRFSVLHAKMMFLVACRQHYIRHSRLSFRRQMAHMLNIDVRISDFLYFVMIFFCAIYLLLWRSS